MAGKQDHQPAPAGDHPAPSFDTCPPAGPRFDTRTGRPLGSDPGQFPARAKGQTPRPLRRRTFVRDLVLLALHLAVYVVVIGGILYQLEFIGYDALSVRSTTFDGIFWPAYAWGTLIAAQAGATVLQRRRFVGAVLGAMVSVLLGTWVLGQFVSYEVTAIVFRSIAVALTALTLGISLIRRPPAFMLTDATNAVPRPVGGPVLAGGRRPRVVSFPSVLLGIFALVFVLAGIANGTYRALEVRGSGETGERDFALKAFDRISVSGTGRLNVQPGDGSGVSMSGDANLLQYADVSVNDGQLTIDFHPGAGSSVHLQRPLTYIVTMTSLTALSIGGDIDAWIDPSFDIGNLRVVAQDRARFTSPVLSGGSFSAAVRDRARLTLNGRVDAIAIEADDNAVVDLENLATADASVTARASSFVILGQTTVLTFQQSGVATIQCAVGTVVQPGSLAEVPQCVDSPPEVSEPFPYDGTGR